MLKKGLIKLALWLCALVCFRSTLIVWQIPTELSYWRGVVGWALITAAFIMLDRATGLIMRRR